MFCVLYSFCTVLKPNGIVVFCVFFMALTFVFVNEKITIRYEYSMNMINKDCALSPNLVKIQAHLCVAD